MAGLATPTHVRLFTLRLLLPLLWLLLLMT